MQIYFIYPIYTSVLALLVLALVPRQQIRRLAIYGILLGTVLDFSLIIIYGLLGLANYQNYGPFGYGMIPFFPLIAWNCYYILFFYFLPKKRWLIIMFIIVASGFNTLFSHVLQNLGIFIWHYNSLLLQIITYLSWLVLNTWVFLKVKDNE